MWPVLRGQAPATSTEEGPDIGVAGTRQRTRLHPVDTTGEAGIWQATPRRGHRGSGRHATRLDERAHDTLPCHYKVAGSTLDTTRFTELRRGLLEYLILAIVGSDDVYAADILDRLHGTDFATREGTLYPLLSRMRRDGLLDYEWQESTAGPPRKYYRLTDAGRAQLVEFREYWQSLTTLIETLGS